MIMLARKIRIKFIGDDNYLPENISRDNWIPVIGWEVRRRSHFIPANGKEKIMEDVFFHCIGNNGKMQVIASFNCMVRIDESAEINFKQATDLLANVVTMGKILCEKLAAQSEKINPENRTVQG